MNSAPTNNMQSLLPERLDKMQQQLDRIEAKLDKLLARDPVNKTGWPLHVPTIEEEFAAVKAQGGDLLEYIKERNKKKITEKKRAITA